MWLASATDYTIELWNVQDGGATIQKISLANLVTSLDFSPDSTELVSGSSDTTVKIWNVDNSGTLSLSNTLKGHTDWVHAVKFSPDAKFIASASSGNNDNTIKIWDVDDDGGALIHTLTGHTSNVYTLSFSPDGKTLASGSVDGTIRLWNMEEGGTAIGSFTGHSWTIASLDFSPDGTQLASASLDSTVKIWDFENKSLSLVRSLQLVNGVNCVKYRPDGAYLASGSDDGTVQLWNRDDDYALFETFRRHTSAVLSIDFSPDGQKIATSAEDRTIQIWGTVCRSGYYGAHLECQPCAPGTQSKADMDSCLPCAAGTYSGAGAAECDTCSAGTFQPQKGQATCDKCPAGGYCANKAAADTCDGGFTACPIGTFSTVTGDFTGSSCIQCPPGTFSDNKTGLVNCFECPKGTYQDKAGKSKCNPCDSGTFQSRTGQLQCDNCPPGTYPDQSSISCLQCPYRLGSDGNSKLCPFCADEFYLNVQNVSIELLNKEPLSFCLPCPDNVKCDKNTTLTTLKGDPGFWRDSLQTAVFYQCNENIELCLGGLSCAEGHGGVKCEVCDDKERYFDESKGECVECPLFSRLGSLTGIVAGIFLFLFVMKFIAYRYAKIEPFITKMLLSLSTIGLQTKFKIMASFFQVVTTFRPVYGVRMHSAFISWFRVFDFFNFGLANTFGIPSSCIGSMKERLLIGAGWPFALVLVLLSGIFIYMVAVDMKKVKRKDAISKCLSRSLYGTIVIFYFTLPSVCQQIFDARTCTSFVSNDLEVSSSSYLIANWNIKCEDGDSDYKDVQQVFWALFVLWPVAVPVSIFVLTLIIRPSVQSNSITPLAEACQFLWFDYDQQMMFWEVIDVVRKIILTGLILFIQPEEGSEKVLRLLVATMICIFYGTILSRARPYKRKDDLDLAILSNMLLTCCFLVGIIIHQCKEDEDADGVCMELFGLRDSYSATAIAVILTSSMLISFILFVLVQSMNDLTAPIVRLVSTNGAPHLGMPEDCKYHLFVSHIWTSGQDKVHKIVRTLKLYLHEVNIWLDVDVLENLGDLENSVTESAHFVLFYSKGFFNSVNCRREVMKAMEADKPMTIIFEPDDESIDIIVQMKEEFTNFWPQDLSPNAIEKYIFGKDPIMWISNGKQFSLESIKLVAGRLLKDLPFYKKNSGLLDAGLKIKGEATPVEIWKPLDILYCSTNIGASDVANKLVGECKGDVKAREMNLSDTDLQKDDRQAVMLVYLNSTTFQASDCLLCESIKRAIDKEVKVVLVHENDVNKNGCAFGEIMNQTPDVLLKKPYNIYAQDIAVGLYSTEEYQKISILQLLTKMGAKPIGTKSVADFLFNKEHSIYVQICPCSDLFRF